MNGGFFSRIKATRNPNPPQGFGRIRPSAEPEHLPTHPFSSLDSRSSAFPLLHQSTIAATFHFC